MECPENNWTGFFSVFTCKTTQTFTHLQSVNEPKRKLKTDVADLAKREDAKNPAKTKTKQQNTVGPKAISTKTNRRLLKVPLILAENGCLMVSLLCFIQFQTRYISFHFVTLYIFFPEQPWRKCRKKVDVGDEESHTGSSS